MVQSLVLAILAKISFLTLAFFKGSTDPRGPFIGDKSTLHRIVAFAEMLEGEDIYRTDWPAGLWTYITIEHVNSLLVDSWLHVTSLQQ